MFNKTICYIYCHNSIPMFKCLSDPYYQKLLTKLIKHQTPKNCDFTNEEIPKDSRWSKMNKRCMKLISMFQFYTKKLESANMFMFLTLWLGILETRPMKSRSCCSMGNGWWWLGQVTSCSTIQSFLFPKSNSSYFTEHIGKYGHF